ncbi:MULTISPECIES: aspartate kinase [Sphingobacterium]|jgi:aspartate kinase|uniref:aspartate kinase n=1 Tax=Sphingobacterium TaxID=28453 RepID=UPI00038A43E0|nr:MULTISPECIES: aspartate kinase [Sphingobacterium]KKX49435.1 aspartate kinase [Sphingobacterium sp. IITKGP-BTPF85]MBB2950288.1 aspartate kinase [Sphingobacterium sp. JUb56]MCW2258808.1 aspartate kinase [Sphingobacterium kitahiroshimense]NJI73083.1 aspartate kinase [Sphingobacterium sp. B16(2022)]QQD13049.1 aspartate kinase [Sphingobacterium sp. UDSM-2020]
MQVFKFGGASVKDAESVKNSAHIISKYKVDALLVVVSAMGKTTNLLEDVTKAYHQNTGEAFEILEKAKAFHYNILSGLFEDSNHPIFDEIANCFVEIEWILEEEPQDSFDYLFDQIVSTGEIVSSKILAAYLNHIGVKSQWLDARNYIMTDNTYTEAQVNWEKTEAIIQAEIPKILSEYIGVTQGFIGSTSENFTTTLGREGSDYSAAIFAACLNAEHVTIWKDVPGVLNADPKWFEKTELIPELSYTDAIELTYYGATVIHPKTIKPLQNKNIQLNVRSFLNPEVPGTKIKSTNVSLPVPSFIFKVNQILISISPRDFSFIVEDNLRDIFNLFHQFRIKINMMHNSAINFSVAVDDTGQNILEVLDELKKKFKVNIETGLELITIRYYNQETINRVLVDKQVISELKDTYTCQLLVKKI